MEPTEIVALALEGVKLGAAIIEAVNAGNLDQAQALLTKARDHYASASAAWDKLVAQP